MSQVDILANIVDHAAGPRIQAGALWKCKSEVKPCKDPKY